jgi:hypothetical protein
LNSTEKSFTITSMSPIMFFLLLGGFCLLVYAGMYGSEFFRDAPWLHWLVYCCLLGTVILSLIEYRNQYKIKSYRYNDEGLFHISDGKFYKWRELVWYEVGYNYNSQKIMCLKVKFLDMDKAITFDGISELNELCQLIKLHSASDYNVGKNEIIELEVPGFSRYEKIIIVADGILLITSFNTRKFFVWHNIEHLILKKVDASYLIEIKFCNDEIYQFKFNWETVIIADLVLLLDKCLIKSNVVKNDIEGTVDTELPLSVPDAPNDLTICTVSKSGNRAPLMAIVWSLAFAVILVLATVIDIDSDNMHSKSLFKWLVLIGVCSVFPLSIGILNFYMAVKCKRDVGKLSYSRNGIKFAANFYRWQELLIISEYKTRVVLTFKHNQTILLTDAINEWENIHKIACYYSANPIIKKTIMANMSDMVNIPGKVSWQTPLQYAEIIRTSFMQYLKILVTKKGTKKGLVYLFITGIVIVFFAWLLAWVDPDRTVVQTGIDILYVVMLFGIILFCSGWLMLIIYKFDANTMAITLHENKLTIAAGKGRCNTAIPYERIETYKTVVAGKYYLLVLALVDDENMKFVLPMNESLRAQIIKKLAKKIVGKNS